MIGRHRMHGRRQRVFHGATTLGEKGQVVVPIEARKAMGIKKGEKLLVFGMGKDVLILSKLSNLEKWASHLTKRLDTLKSYIDKAEKN